MIATLATTTVTVPTYPARPVSGGPLLLARPKTGDWIHEPKYNGWRTLVHLPTGAMFNRKGERLSITREFQPALDQLKSLWTDHGLQWVDAEALERRHGIGRGCLIIFDILDYATHSLRKRRALLQTIIPSVLALTPPTPFPLLSLPPYIPANLETWSTLQAINSRLGCQFYEGIVAKRDDSFYPMQLRHPETAFPFWAKHRWKF